MKVLITPYGGGSIAHVVRCLAVADELKKRGHELLFTAPKTKKAFIENRGGYKVFGDGHADVNLNDEQDQSINYFKRHHNQFINWLNDEIKAAESFQPDIIINSPSFFGPLAAHKLKVPYVTIINAQWLMEFQGLLGLGKSRNHPGDAILRRLAKPIFAKKFDDVYMAEIKQFYKKLDIPYVPERRHDLYRHNPFLIPSIPQFEPIERTKRDDLHYVGPLFWQGLEKESFEPTKHFKDYGKKPLVYVTLGGSIYRKRSYDDLIEALARQTDWNILVTIGPNFERSAFPANSSHMVIRSFVSGLQACEAADVVINTGSHGTVMQALWHGKPVVAIPHNIDQATIAARLVELQLGVNLNKIGIKDFSDREKYFKRATSITWDHVIAQTEKLLADRKTQERAKAFGQRLRQYDHGDQKAADYIEQYARRG